VSASTLTVIALALPAVVVMLVLVMGVGGTGQSEFDLCVESAVQAAIVARHPLQRCRRHHQCLERRPGSRPSLQ